MPSSCGRFCFNSFKGSVERVRTTKRADALLLQYYFNVAGNVRSYVGAGLNYTLFYNNGLHAGDTPVSIKNSSFGPALQAGINAQVARNLYVNFDIKKIWMRTSASADDTSLGSLRRSIEQHRENNNVCRQKAV
jgi:outer membrane protein W